MDSVRFSALADTDKVATFTPKRTRSSFHFTWPVPTCRAEGDGMFDV